MTALFVCFILALVATLVAALARLLTRGPNASLAVSNARGPLAWGVIGGAALSVFLLFCASYNQVGTKDEGIETSFGATTGHLSNGFHLTWPWVQVHTMDAAIQTDSYTQADKDCLPVRIANQQTGCVDVSIRWRIQPASVDELYRDYRSFDHVRNSLVTRELTAAVNAQFADYNPLDSIAYGTPAGGVKNPPLATLALRITKQMQGEIGSQIEVISTIVPIIHYDEETQARLNQLQQQIALTRIAEQELTTNQKQAEANNALAHSVDAAPNVLVAQCLSILETMVKASQSVPAGFSCWPNGGPEAVIAGSAK